jgi:hypothetical protein
MPSLATSMPFQQLFPLQQRGTAVMQQQEQQQA